MAMWVYRSVIPLKCYHPKPTSRFMTRTSPRNRCHAFRSCSCAGVSWSTDFGRASDPMFLLISMPPPPHCPTIFLVINLQWKVPTQVGEIILIVPNIPSSTSCKRLKFPLFLEFRPSHQRWQQFPPSAVPFAGVTKALPWKRSVFGRESYGCVAHLVGWCLDHSWKKFDIIKECLLVAFFKLSIIGLTKRGSFSCFFT